MQKQTQINLWYLAAAIVGVLALQDLWVEAQKIEQIPYSRFERLLQNDQIEQITVRRDFIIGTYRTPQDGRTRFA
ncbi:MAG: ATP-dependent metallopeptidase FtsH/Yme1/Tma family protein, partial [Halochromatium sp.]